MNKQQYYTYLKSQSWKEIAVAAKNRDKWKCRLCNSGLDLNVHHRSYDILGKEADHMEDLVTLCARCHKTFHHVVPEPKEAPALAKKKESGKSMPTKFWGQGKLRKNIEINRVSELARQEILQHLPDGEVELTMDVIRCCLTFGCGLHAKAEGMLRVGKRNNSGWMKKLVGRKIQKSDLSLLFGITQRRELGQIREGRTCNVL